MAVTLTGTGGLFTRLGVLGGALNDLNTYRSTTLVNALEDIDNQYEANDQKLMDQLYQNRTAHQSSMSGLATYLKNLANSTVIEQVHRDTALVSKDIVTALTELIAQMTTSADDVNGATVSVTVTPGGSNVGNPVVVASVKGPDGKNLQYLFAETLVATVTSDQLTGSTARREPVTVRGVVAVTDPLSHDWPGGSGTSTALALVDSALDQSASSNLLRNSDYEDFTSNVPDKWAVVVGTAGTDILAGGSGDVFRAGTSNCLEFDGDGATLSAIAQTFNDATNGTSQRLRPGTVYAVNFWSKVDVVPAGGVLEVSLTDSSNVILQNDNGDDLKVQVTLSGETSTYAAHTAFFQTPSNLPASHKIRVRLSTALSSGSSVFIDDLSLVAATRLYTGGPYLAAFAADTDVAVGDTWDVAVTATNGAFQELFEKFFSMRALGLTLPFDEGGTETISDSLIA